MTNKYANLENHCTIENKLCEIEIKIIRNEIRPVNYRLFIVHTHNEGGEIKHLLVYVDLDAKLKD